MVGSLAAPDSRGLRLLLSDRRRLSASLPGKA